MRTSNPALSDKIFKDVRTDETRMTLSGTVNKCYLLIGILLVAAFWSWRNTLAADGTISIPGWYLPGIIATFIISLVIIFKKTSAPYLAWIYAAGEGLLLGALSALYEVKYNGIVLQAVCCTAGVFIALLFAYKTKLIQATENFKLGVVAATGGIAIVYLISFVASFWNVQIPYLHDSSPIGIGISVFIVIIAALNLVLDFDFIEKGAEAGAPKYMEWYAAFGLLVTLVWLYLEILRLLSKTRKK